MIIWWSVWHLKSCVLKNKTTYVIRICIKPSWQSLRLPSQNCSMTTVPTPDSAATKFAAVDPIGDEPVAEPSYEIGGSASNWVLRVQAPALAVRADLPPSPVLPGDNGGRIGGHPPHPLHMQPGPLSHCRLTTEHKCNFLHCQLLCWVNFTSVSGVNDDWHIG